MTAVRRALGAAVAGVVCAVLMAGCGVPLQDEAQPVPGVRPQGSTSTAGPGADQRLVDLWLVSDSRLVRDRTRLPRPVTAAGLLSALAATPAGDGSARSLVLDPITGGPLVTVPHDVQLRDGEHPIVTVQVTPSFSALPPAEQVLLLGQVVLTLTGAGAGGVLVTDSQGSPLAVPLPDGRLLAGPATGSDYLPLTLPPTPSAGPLG